MTYVGHTIAGVSIGVLCMPTSWSPLRKTILLFTFAFLSNFPDAPLPCWGHNRYAISHSVFITLLAAAILAGLLTLWRRGRRVIGGWPVIIGGILAWLSHLLLDSFYNHGKGIAIFWPISRARLNMPIPWFRIMDVKNVFSLYNLEVYSIEALFYGGILMLCLLLRYRFAAKMSKPGFPI